MEGGALGGEDGGRRGLARLAGGEDDDLALGRGQHVGLPRVGGEARRDGDVERGRGRRRPWTTEARRAASSRCSAARLTTPASNRPGTAARRSAPRGAPPRRPAPLPSPRWRPRPRPRRQLAPDHPLEDHAEVGMHLGRRHRLGRQVLPSPAGIGAGCPTLRTPLAALLDHVGMMPAAPAVPVRLGTARLARLVGCPASRRHRLGTPEIGPIPP